MFLFTLTDEYSEETDYESEYEEEKEKGRKSKKDILAGLKDKLGIPPINKVFRSSKLNKQKNEGEYLTRINNQNTALKVIKIQPIIMDK